MSDEFTISLSITPTWSILKDVKEKTASYMHSKGYAEDVIDATIMCASELIENAIKYGSERPDGTTISFDLKTDSKTIIISVSNGVRTDEDRKNVFEHIEKLRNNTDPAKLYTDRLMELMNNPRPGISQLGLYRIAYEGEFSLDCSFANNTLTILAKRKLS